MLTSQRRKRIVEMVQADSAVTVAQLLNLFDVSPETIRKDLLFLEKANELTRVHGGAVVKNSVQPFRDIVRRTDEHRPEKQKLSELAAELVEENDIIGIDSGTTAVEFAEVLAKNFHALTIVTYSMDIFGLLHDYKDFNLILCGGNYLKKERTFYGLFAHKILDDIHLRKAFLCPSAISLKYGVYDHQPQLVELQRRLVENSDQVILLADSSKFEKSALYKICDMDPKHIYVSDPTLSKNVKALYQANQCRIITEADDLHKKASAKEAEPSSDPSGKEHKP